MAKAAFTMTFNISAYGNAPATAQLVEDYATEFAIPGSVQMINDGRQLTMGFSSKTKAALAALEIMTFVSGLTTGDINFIDNSLK